MRHKSHQTNKSIEDATKRLLADIKRCKRDDHGRPKLYIVLRDATPYRKTRYFSYHLSIPEDESTIQPPLLDVTTLFAGILQARLYDVHGEAFAIKDHKGFHWENNSSLVEQALGIKFQTTRL